MESPRLPLNRSVSKLQAQTLGKLALLLVTEVAVEALGNQSLLRGSVLSQQAVRGPESLTYHVYHSLAPLHRCCLHHLRQRLLR